MKTLLITILETFYDTFLQGTLNPDDAYPDSFITFWTYASNHDSFYDNNENSIVWSVTVIFYSDNPALVASEPPQIIAALKNAGFVPQGRGNDIPSDVSSHTGWAMDFVYKEKII